MSGLLTSFNPVNSVLSSMHCVLPLEVKRGVVSVIFWQLIAEAPKDSPNFEAYNTCTMGCNVAAIAEKGNLQSVACRLTKCLKLCLDLISSNVLPDSITFP